MSAGRVFDPDGMASAFRERPLGALRLLLEAAEAGHIEVVSGNAEGIGGPRWDDRAHMLIKLDVATCVIQGETAPQPNPEDRSRG